MNKLAELIDKLQAVDPDIPDNTPAFETLLADVFALRTPESICPLLTLFRDNAQYDELMFSIIHGHEIFDDTAYVAEILRGALRFAKSRPVGLRSFSCECSTQNRLG